MICYKWAFFPARGAVWCADGQRLWCRGPSQVTRSDRHQRTGRKQKPLDARLPVNWILEKDHQTAETALS